MHDHDRSGATPTELGFEGDRHEIATRHGTVSYLDVGYGPTAVFVHGVGTNAYLWRHVIGAVQARRRCIAIDLPLHGLSPLAPGQPLGLRAFADLLTAVIDELDLTAVDLVANDTGGAVAQIAAARCPDRLATLTLTNCEAHDNVPPRALRPTIWLARIGLLARLAPRSLGTLERARRTVYRDGYEDLDALPLGVVASFLEPIVGDRSRAHAFQRLLLSLKAADLLAVEAELHALPIPALVVWGTDDRFFPTMWARWLCDTLPRVTGPIYIEGGRLFFPDERAAELTEHLITFWEDAE